MEENNSIDKDKPIRIRTRLRNMIYKEKSFFFMVFAMTGLLACGAYYTYKTFSGPYSTSDIVITAFVDLCSLFLCVLVYSIVSQWSEVVGRLRMDIKTGQTRIANMDLASYSIVEERHTRAVAEKVEALGSDIVEGINRGTKDSMEYISRTFSSVLNETMVNLFDNTLKQANTTNANVAALQKQMEKIVDRFDSMDERYTIMSDFINGMINSGAVAESTSVETPAEEGKKTDLVPDIFAKDNPRPGVEEKISDEEEINEERSESEEESAANKEHYDRLMEEEILAEQRRYYGTESMEDLSDWQDEEPDDEAYDDEASGAVKTVDAEEAGKAVSPELDNL